MTPSWDPEEITKDVPGVGDDALKDLDAERESSASGADAARTISWWAR